MDLPLHPPFSESCQWGKGEWKGMQTIHRTRLDIWTGQNRGCLVVNFRQLLMMKESAKTFLPGTDLLTAQPWALPVVKSETRQSLLEERISPAWKVPGGVVLCVSFRDLEGRVGQESDAPESHAENTIQSPPFSPSSYKRAVCEGMKTHSVFLQKLVWKAMWWVQARGSWLPGLLPLGKSRCTSGRVQRSPSGTHVPHPCFWGSCPSHLWFPAAQGGRGVATGGTHPLQHGQCRCCIVHPRQPCPSAVPSSVVWGKDLLIQSGRSRGQGWGSARDRQNKELENIFSCWAKHCVGTLFSLEDG